MDDLQESVHVDQLSLKYFMLNVSFDQLISLYPI